ncbi:uncharacterized protein BX663DRAFT_576010 [Cokeromyces recurvatus]|uniref:uncharacterized protein n=1 Tax=Cokeromyces recurvatus TaxID=90255 RepID=UPI00221FEC31|nr:uncharacterized protein BX663DRAFT_576010 [Cokeromyces recurvatus]KAI7899955.1 hypothetical protein BX663DRAFT_576010 [Cokeromyces recurvatus]
MENNTNTTEENATRQSSKFSLDSSPSILSADDQLEGDGPLTPTDKMEDDVEDEDDDEVPIKHAIDDDDDDLSALNSILQAGSPGSLSEEEEEEEENDIDDLHQDSASPLSSIPDDFPLSRSPSPEIPQEEELELENKMKEDYTDNTETKIKKERRKKRMMKKKKERKRIKKL